ncbi:MAG TPA: hypothetical protein VH081_09350 [Solirubrobacteraceae bacterium]|jgi:hypothetical protein|nr:hypothetical protein [Solirubrobacteraceae bacterium]
MKPTPLARIARAITLPLLTAAVLGGIFSPAVAEAEMLPTTLTVSASSTQPLVGQRVAYTAELDPMPFEGEVTFDEDGTPISGCTNMWTGRKCSVQYG